MNKSENFVITINREIGSGGRTVGSKLAAKLGVPFYDKALVEALMEQYHLSADEIEELKGRKQDWWTEFKHILGIASAKSNSIIDEPDLYNSADIFKAEQKILLNIAAKGSCVIAGRSGFFVFQDYPNHLNVMITAPMEHRIQRLMSKQDINEEAAKDIIRRVDTMRENYIQKYTGTTRYDLRNYDLAVSMQGKTEDEVADLIFQYIGSR
jgi:cytidylate kinase